jgi:hypothetical protein
MTNNKQQTAVEWLAEQMLYPEFANPYIEQAKEMEKEQTIDFAFNALKIADNTMNGYVDVDKLYEQTYGGDK